MARLFIFLLTTIPFQLQAQVVDIPDQNFKNLLLNDPWINLNGDEDIQVDEAERVTFLFVEYSNIQSLSGIESFVNLTNLNCSANQITHIDLSENTLLETLDMSENPIESLDVSANTILVSLTANFCYLAEIDIASLSNLAVLSLEYNQLTEIDLSSNEKITDLNLSSNSLTSIDVSKLRGLKYLNLHSNRIEAIDVSENPELEDLDVWYNPIGVIDLSHNQKLKSVNVMETGLSVLNVTSNPLLDYLLAGGNNLTEIDVSNNAELTYLSLEGNNLSNIDVSQNIKLGLLSVYRNAFTTLDISLNIDLSVLSVDENKLTNLDISNNPKLSSLSFDDNNISEIDLSIHSSLTFLSCDNNNLSELNIDSTTKLISLYCNNNKLQTLDLSKQPNFFLIEVNNNMLKNLDFSHNPKLRWMKLNNNQLEYLNLANGIVPSNYTNAIEFNGNPNLQFICVDAFELEPIAAKALAYGYESCLISTNCIFNVRPVIEAQVNEVEIDRGTSYTIALDNLAIIDPDNELSDFSVTVYEGINYTFDGNAITPIDGFYGSLSVPISVNDGFNESEQFLYSIEVACACEIPVIEGQVGDVAIDQGTSVSILPEDLVITDPDSDLSDFTLTVYEGLNYTFSGNTITSGDGFYGSLSVPVSVNDGFNESEIFHYSILVDQVLNATDGLEPNIKIYPNPSSSKIHLASNSKINVVNIINLNAQVVLTTKITSHDLIVIDVSNLSGGIYYLEAIDSQGVGTLIKLILGN